MVTFPLIDLDDLGDDPVQEIPVMGYDEHSSGIIEQIGFQPGDGIHIQVVGGLVQKDDIRMGKQKLSQSHTGLLAAGKRG